MKTNKRKSRATFWIRLSKVPEAIKEEVHSITKNYTVPIVINDELVGSGTLVKVANKYGVLTAEHVINHPRRPDLRLDTCSSTGPKLLLPPADFPAGIPVDAAALQIIKTTRKTDKFGPDLALIVLPPSPLLTSLKSRRSFYPLSLFLSRDIRNGVSKTGFASFCGFPAERQRPHVATLGYSKITEIRGYAFLTGIDRYKRFNGWDYCEVGISRKEIGEFVESFGGVSGGGLWRFQVQRKKSAKPGSETLGLLTLSGVAFYEEENRKHRRFFIRAHGARSIYSNFVKQITNQLGAG